MGREKKRKASSGTVSLSLANGCSRVGHSFAIGALASGRSQSMNDLKLRKAPLVRGTPPPSYASFSGGLLMENNGY